MAYTTVFLAGPLKPSVAIVGFSLLGMKKHQAYQWYEKYGMATIYWGFKIYKKILM
jgi:hypothetical protein